MVDLDISRCYRARRNVHAERGLVWFDWIEPLPLDGNFHWFPIMTIGIRLIVPTDGRRFYLGTNLSYQPLEMVKSNRTKQTKRNQTTQTQPGRGGAFSTIESARSWNRMTERALSIY